MAYTKNTWTDGDIVTSEKLNHMEDGIANAGGIMVINDTDGTLDKTWQEIHDAMAQGKLCVIRRDVETLASGIEAYIVILVYLSGEEYKVKMSNDERTYTASSATGYPGISIGPIIPG